jgi:hypothetical protein
MAKNEIIKCQTIINQGPRKGSQCGVQCLKGKKTCSYHNEDKDKYTKVVYNEAKYMNLVLKTQELINETAEAIKIINKEQNEINKCILGLKIVMGEESADVYNHDDYIPYKIEPKSKLQKKRITLEKRRRELNVQKKEIQVCANKLKQANDIFNVDVDE